MTLKLFANFDFIGTAGKVVDFVNLLWPWGWLAFFVVLLTVAILLRRRRTRRGRVKPKFLKKKAPDDAKGIVFGKITKGG